LNIKLSKLLHFSVLGLALLGLSVYAQQFNYTDGDLILDFSKTGSSDVEINIGNITNLVSAANAAGGTMQLNGLDYNITSQLLGTFGDVNNLSFTVFGLQNLAAGSVAAQTVYLTQQQTGATANSPPNDVTGTKQSGLVGAVNAIVGLGQATGIRPWSLANPANSINNTAKVVIIPTSGVSAADSYTTIGPSAWSGNAPSSPPIANSTSATFSTDGGSVISDLFEYDNLGKTHLTIFKGYFTFKSDGTMSFSVAGSQAPPSTLITSITATNQTVTVSFNTTNGVNYSLFYTTNLSLARSSWTSNSIPPFAGTGSTGTLTDTTASNAARFYTVQSHY